MINEGIANTWNTVMIIPILKPNKDPCFATSYRPISLPSCIFKTFERLIKARLELWLYIEHPLPANQFGFRKTYGTIDATSTLATDIQSNLTKNEFLMAAFLDFTKAYDSVDLNTLQKKTDLTFCPS